MTRKTLLLFTLISFFSYNFTFFGLFGDDKPKTEKVKKKKKKKDEEKGKYKKFSKVITKEAQVDSTGMFTIYKQKNKYYFNVPFELLKREYIVINKVSKVSTKLNLFGLNKGLNYENKIIGFQFNSDSTKLYLQAQDPFVSVDENSNIAESVEQNFAPANMFDFKVECFNEDTSGVVFEVTQLFDGSSKALNNAFGFMDGVGSLQKTLSQVKSIKSFDRNIVAKSDFTQKANQKGKTYYFTVESTVNIVLLDKTPMMHRFTDSRVGYFNTKKWIFSDSQHAVEQKEVITKWNLVPQDTAAYLAGKLVEPVKPIVFYIDPATPGKWQSYLLSGVEKWNVAFEKAGFKNAIQAKMFPKDGSYFDPDDANFSSIAYAASETANAMGPNVVDPRSGEVIEADIMWWHNVMTVASRWAKTQLSGYVPGVRKKQIDDDIMGKVLEFVACHEVGHTLGLKHNMRSSSLYPTDSLRSKSFTYKMGNTAPSIMDYSRLNYIAQPGDDVRTWCPAIGEYDKFAIEWAYRWYNVKSDAEMQEKLHQLIAKYKSNPYVAYGEQQNPREAIDPRSLSEDMGSDPIKGAEYAINDFKLVADSLTNWYFNKGDNYHEVGTMFYGLTQQWSMHLYHVLANVGGIYIENTFNGDGKQTYTHVEKELQKNALKFLQKQVLTFPKWLLGKEELNRNVLANRHEGRLYLNYSPISLFKNNQAYLLWDLLSDERIGRMVDNEMINGSKAYSPVELLDDLHAFIFAKTTKGQKLNLYERITQKNYIDALLVGVAKKYPVSKLRAIENDHSTHNCAMHQAEFLDLTVDPFIGIYDIFKYSVTYRASENISVKRGELIRIKELLKKRLRINDKSTKYHYQDMIRRIEHIVGK